MSAALLIWSGLPSSQGLPVSHCGQAGMGACRCAGAAQRKHDPVEACSPQAGFWQSKWPTMRVVPAQTFVICPLLACTDWTPHAKYLCLPPQQAFVMLQRPETKNRISPSAKTSLHFNRSQQALSLATSASRLQKTPGGI